MYLISIILLILLIPQFYYWIKERKYESLGMSKKFFKRSTVYKEENYEELYLTNTDGFDLFVRILTSDNAKGIVHIVHGVAEHSENYMDFAKFLNDNNYIVVIDDHRGHGRSISTSYPNGYMARGQELVDDEVMVACYIQKKYPDLKYYMLGHSMGSMIARLFLRENDILLNKLILTGTVPVNKFAWLGVFFENIFCFYFGEQTKSRLIYKIIGSEDSAFISYNQENIDYKDNDSMRISNFKIAYSRSLIELNMMLGRKSKYLVNNPDLEIYNMVGEDDIITKGKDGVKSSLEFLSDIGYKNISSTTYPNMKHEILNEKDNNVVYADILQYLEK